MSTERSGSAITNAQQLFWKELNYPLASLNPLEAQETAQAKMMAITEQIGQLTLGGKQLEHGAVEAEYEAFIQPVWIDETDELGEPVITESRDRIEICRIQYAPQGFRREGIVFPLLWAASFEVEQRPDISLFCSPDGRLHRTMGNSSNLFDVRHGSEPQVTASHFGGLFNDYSFIQRNY